MLIDGESTVVVYLNCQLPLELEFARDTFISIHHPTIPFLEFNLSVPDSA